MPALKILETSPGLEQSCEDKSKIIEAQFKNEIAETLNRLFGKKPDITDKRLSEAAKQI